MIYGYVRVSTKGQLEGNSIEEQMKTIRVRYPDAAIMSESFSASGASERPIFIELIRNLQNGDILVVTKLDRFCRSTKEGLEYIDRLIQKGVLIHILNMGLIEDTPMGRLIITNLLAFAEFERAMIIERTQSGKAIAKLHPGFKEGRPRKYSKEQIALALSLLNEKSYSQVEKMTGISKSTLTRAKRELDSQK
ncbi:recombinase family protein [Anaeromicropila populeti]|uniref:Site-specific DNA recombinase n=1 Tax=Anaeromicropila populeti TaxID=37658 RepID=A0A1I6LWS2_9FIRM|nr:recombinase family protein [Anaeromicropila populeti]SFS07886.1 Site-specific DNA recombinase [Anaeromicropila populeti]